MQEKGLTEKILTKKKNGMAMLFATIGIYLLAIAGFIAGIVMISKNNNPALLIVSIIVMCSAWILFFGLKVLRPQEALVLTLFGKYVGTLKGDGFLLCQSILCQH